MRRWFRAGIGSAAVVAVFALLAALAAGGALDRFPLLDPRLAVGVEAAAVLVLTSSWWSRDWRWMRWRLPVVLLLAAAVTGATAAVLRETGAVTDAYPPSFALWVGLVLAAFAGTAPTWRRGGQLRRVVALAAVPLTIAGAFLLINDQYGLWPTVSDLRAHGDANADPLQLLHLPPGAVRPDKGVVAALDVPATRSHFAHRAGSVYLPPAYFSLARAKLPVIIMLAGAPGSPSHWISAGHAVETADGYAAAHHGNAPILVFVDQNGSGTGDTECVDGPQGMAETYLTVDVPAFVAKTLRVPHNANRWGVVGFSEGGTCALDLTLGHPTVFHHFADLAGDLQPTLGDSAHTLSALFGGSADAQAAHDPGRLLADKHYKGITGWFAAGEADQKKVAVAHRLSTAAGGAGIGAHEFTGVAGHNWQFATDAFRRILPQLGHDLGLHG